MPRTHPAAVTATFLFFAAAVGFFLVGLLALGLGGPSAGSWDPARPAFLAGVHALLVGAMGSIYLGAAHQLYPVVSEHRPRHAGALALTHAALHPLGVGLLLVGLAGGPLAAAVWGGALIGLGLLLFAAVALGALERRRSWAPESIGFFLGTGWLLVAVGIGLWMALGRAGLVAPGLGLGEWRGLHLRAALGGFFLNLLFGLSHRLVPMFLVTRRSGRGWAWSALVALNSGLWLAALGLIAGRPTWSLGGDALVAGAVLLHGGATAVQLASRLRPLGGAFTSYLGGTLGLVVCALAWVAPGSGWKPLAIAFWAGLVPIVFAVSARIIPFLAWQVRCAPWLGRRPLPTVGALWSERLLWAECAVLLLLGGTTAAALLAPRPSLPWVAAGLCGALLATRLFNCGLLWVRLRTFHRTPA